MKEKVKDPDLDLIVINIFDFAVGTLFGIWMFDTTEKAVATGLMFVLLGAIMLIVKRYLKEKKGIDVEEKLAIYTFKVINKVIK